MEFLDEHECVPSAHWIDERVACGSFAAAGCGGPKSARRRRAEALAAAGITHVVNCTRELPCPHAERFDYLHVPAADVDAQDMLSFWEETSDFIDEAVSRGGRVLVHCAGGHSRSGSTVVAWLMRARGLRCADEALDLARARRPVVKPIPAFVDQLRAWGDSGFRPAARARADRPPCVRLRRDSPA